MDTCMPFMAARPMLGLVDIRSQSLCFSSGLSLHFEVLAPIRQAQLHISGFCKLTSLLQSRVKGQESRAFKMIGVRLQYCSMLSLKLSMPVLSIQLYGMRLQLYGLLKEIRPELWQLCCILYCRSLFLKADSWNTVQAAAVTTRQCMYNIPLLAYKWIYEAIDNF